MWGKIFRQIHMEKTWLKNPQNYFLHSVVWVGTHCILLTHSGLGQVLSTLPFTGSDPVHAKHTCVTTTVAFAAFKGTFLKNCGEAIDTPKNQWKLHQRMTTFAFPFQICLLYCLVRYKHCGGSKQRYNANPYPNFT